MHDVCEQDYVDFFGKSREEKLACFADKSKGGTDFRRASFNRIVSDQSDRAQLLAYYDGPEFNADQYFSAICPGYFSMVERMFNGVSHCCLDAGRKLLAENPSLKALDHGCGRARYGIYLSYLGAEVTLADIPGQGFSFLKYVAGKYRPKLKFVTLETDTEPLGGLYDFVMSVEVLEHVLDPVSVLAHMRNHMKTGALIYLSVFFNDMNGHDPSHLLRNNMYQNPPEWFDIVYGMGFALHGKNAGGSEKLFRKVEKKQ